MNIKNPSVLDATVKGPIVTELPPLDERRRYSVEATLAYLDISRGHFYSKVKAGELRVIKDAGRTFVPGAEIARLSSVSSSVA